MSLVSEGMFTLEVSKCLRKHMCVVGEVALLIMWLVRSLIEKVIIE